MLQAVRLWEGQSVGRDSRDAQRETGAGRKWLIARVALSAGALGLALIVLRYGVIEEGLLPRNCGPMGNDSALSCGLSWLLVQSFQVQRLGWLALIAGGLGFWFSLRSLAWLGWLAGVAGLVLYCPDTAAVGALLGLFTLLRQRRGEGAGPDEHGQRQCEARQ
jgi:hypothetical protein